MGECLMLATPLFLNDLLDSVCGRGLFQPHPFLTNQLDWLLGVWLC